MSQPRLCCSLGWGLAASTLLQVLVLGIPVADQGSEFLGGADHRGLVVSLIEGVGGVHEPRSPLSQTTPDAIAPATVSTSEANRRGLASKRPATSEAEDFDNYHSKVYLTTNPEPLVPIEIPALDIAGKRTVQLELSVFVDEHGKVRRVRPESPGVMDAYVQAAVHAFEAAAFKPGEIAGRPVKSVIRVLVEFEQP